MCSPRHEAVGRRRIARADARLLRWLSRRFSKMRTCSALGSSSSVAPSPSSSAVAPALGIAPSCTTIGMPRARASIATWLVGLPCNSARPPPPDQSISRKRDGGRSSAQTTPPLGIFSGSPSSPRRIWTTRSRRSARSDERACRYSSAAALYSAICSSSVERHATSAGRPSPIDAKIASIRSSSSSNATWNSRICAASPPALAARSAICPLARSIALRKASASSTSVPATRSPPVPASTRTSGPWAKPIEAVLPR